MGVSFSHLLLHASFLCGPYAQIGHFLAPISLSGRGGERSDVEASARR